MSSAEPTSAPEPSRENVHRMFDRIAPTYDRANRVLALGADRRWRRRLARHLPPGQNLRVLDLATGTADQILALFEADAPVAEAVGIDLAEDMMALGRAKIRAVGLEDRVRLESGDASAIACPDTSFDAVTMSFGIRNMVSVPATLREIHRVLRPGGRVLILECSCPRSRFVRWGYRMYLRGFIAPVGGWISGDPHAYRYLNVTAETFPSGREFLGLLADAGFVSNRAVPLMLGAISLYVGERPERP